MAEALSGGRDRDLWSEVDRMQRSGAPTPGVVDGVQGEDEVCSLFRHKYSELYSSVGYDAQEMAQLEVRINELCRDSCSDACYCSHTIQTDDVTRAVRKLKRGKSDSNPTLMSDHFINGCSSLFRHMANLLSMMLVHSCVPSGMLHSVLIPIPKNCKKSLNDSSNYRSIAISSLMGKVLDNIVIEKHRHIITCSNLQFGFRSHHSTTQCTFVLREVVELYTFRGSPVYVTLLDATKAFDRVNYVRLFSLLLQRGLCAVTARLLLGSYVRQSMSVRWCNSLSNGFTCSNGVKQGGVLSPILFSVYMDELLGRLAGSGVGCHLNGSFVGSISYADDLSLITPSFNAAKKLLIECEKFSREFNVLFNSAKSHVIVFNRRVDDGTAAKLYLNGSPIDYVDHALHLGTYIGNNATTMNVRHAISGIYARVNSLHSRFHHCSVAVMRKLFTSYCTSLYGCAIWNFRQIESLLAAWRKSIRKLFDLNYRTHSRYISGIIGLPNLFLIMLCRFARFFSQCLFSPNVIVSQCARLSLNSRSNVNINVNILCSLLGLNHEDLIITLSQPQYIARTVYSHIPELTIEDEACVHTIVELLKIRKGEMTSNLSTSEVNDLLFLICVS